jgi:hypothetical protein
MREFRYVQSYVQATTQDDHLQLSHVSEIGGDNVSHRQDSAIASRLLAGANYLTTIQLLLDDTDSRDPARCTDR